MHEALFTPPMRQPAPRGLCTDCGISRTREPQRCGKASPFVKPDYPGLEARVHGRTSDPGRTGEMFFGPFRLMVRASPNGGWRPGRSMRY